jgi:4-amino-4-deoxy-L-arabinose transferase-like glycosyltransferase
MAEPEAPNPTAPRDADAARDPVPTPALAEPAPPQGLGEPAPPLDAEEGESRAAAPDSAPAPEVAAPIGDGEPAASPSEAKIAEPSPFAFLRGGHALRIARGGTTFLVFGVAAFLLMARDTQWRWGVPVGFLAILFSALGALDLIGSFDDHHPWIHGPWGRGTPREPRAILPPARVGEAVDAGRALTGGVATLASLIGTMSLMAFASDWKWGIAITVGWIATCALGFQTLAALGIVDAIERPLKERHGFWLVVFCCLLYLPTLGVHSLIDPWETHYGEVSREILARDDWITIWWAEEGWFLSKPILDFWVQALAMATFGVRYLPDQMIAPKEIGGNPTHPEWIVRFPSLTLSVIALYLAYRAVSQVRGRRAGLLASLVLATMGYWNMLSHQSITDMPFVAALTASMSLLIIGLTTDDEKTVRAVPLRFGRWTFSFSGFHLAMLVILVCALPQALYLVSRNFTLVTQGDFGFAPHLDEYRSGSGHECWMAPGQGDAFERLMRIGKWPCDLRPVVHKNFQPMVQGLLWLIGTFAILAINRNERRISRLCFLVAWVFAGISTMGKGVAGFLLPIAVAGIYVVTARKWRDLLRLELASGVLILLVVAAPWFIAMYARMGDEFIQQLFVHHMWKRALDHVHDTNTGDDVSIRYYVWQLGYGLFPWTGLVPAGLIWWARTRWGAGRTLTLHEERQRDVATFLVMWFVLAWALFTYMKTKFHHYVFPAVPPAAMLTGIFLDEALGKEGDERSSFTRGRTLGWFATSAVGVAVAAYGLSRLVPGTFFGAFDAANPVAANPWVGLAIALPGLAVALVAHRLATTPTDGADGLSTTRATMIGAVALAGAFCTAIVTRDLASRPTADIKGQERLIQLYTYRYDRLWPKEISFTPALLGFGLVAVLLTIFLVSRSARKQAVVALVACAALFSAWTLDVYLVKVAPHWGQRPLFEAYYKDRRSTKEPLVAFEMNWKGENFYSGGRLVEFGNGMGQGPTAGERGSDRMRTWLADMKGKTGAIYFVTEASRVPKIEDQLKGVLGAPPNGKSWTERIVTDEQSNKFTVVRARWR